MSLLVRRPDGAPSSSSGSGASCAGPAEPSSSSARQTPTCKSSPRTIPPPPDSSTRQRQRLPRRRADSDGRLLPHHHHRSTTDSRLRLHRRTDQHVPLVRPAIERVEITAGVATGAGTRFEIVRSLPGGRAINEVKITEYEPSRRITMESQEGPTPFRYRYTLEPSADGTRLRLDGRISSTGLAGPISRHDTIAPSSSSEAWHETSRLSRRSSNPKQPSLDRADCRPMNPNTIVPFLAQGVIASEQPLRRGPSQRDWQRLGTPG